MTSVDWHGIDAWQIENDTMRVIIVPQLGAKIASLVDKASGHEWLAPPTNPVRLREYGDRFTDHDLGGWDEMFPTIDACPSPHDPRVQLPDHGEVWALPWETVERDDQSITLRVRGRALDYTLTRTAVIMDGGLRLDYQLQNHTGQSLPYLWAAHPLFNGDEHTRVVLPETIGRAVSVAGHPLWGEPGARYDWPEAILPNGEVRRMDMMGDSSRNDYRKFYVLPVAFASLHREDIGRAIHLAWNRDLAPYLGIWVDEGLHTRETTVALEPATGFYDTLERAIELERVASIPPDREMHWSLVARLMSI